jgi:cysteinyl-tRNA synthetase
MHGNMLTMNGKKMAKSTGNNILPEEIFTGNNPNISKAFAPSVARFFMMQAHYRSVLDFSNDAMLAAEKGYNRLMDAMNLLPNLIVSESSSIDLERWKEDCYVAMSDDFNTPILIAHLFEAVKWINLIKEGKETISASDMKLLEQTLKDFVLDVLGLENTMTGDDNSEKLDGVVKVLIALREQARADKNWALSDQIRDDLAAQGIQLKDGKDGTSYSFI